MSVPAGLAAVLADETHQIQGGLSTAAHIFLAVGALCSIAFILFLLRRRQLRGKYAMLWTASALTLGVLAAFPGLLTKISEWLGVSYPPILFAGRTGNAGKEITRSERVIGYGPYAAGVIHHHDRNARGRPSIGRGTARREDKA